MRAPLPRAVAGSLWQRRRGLEAEPPQRWAVREGFALLGAGPDFVMPPSLCRAATERGDPRVRQVTAGQEDSR